MTAFTDGARVPLADRCGVGELAVDGEAELRRAEAAAKAHKSATFDEAGAFVEEE